jgi:steroid delta-isomerase
MRQRFIDYLAAYEAKQLDAIAPMFDDDIVLRDWNLCVRGKEAALRETRKNFEAAQSLRIEILRLHESGATVAGELRITVDDATVIHVIDVVDFTASGRIAAIRAYIGRGDD